MMTEFLQLVGALCLLFLLSAPGVLIAIGVMNVGVNEDWHPVFALAITMFVVICYVAALVTGLTHFGWVSD